MKPENLCSGSAANLAAEISNYPEQALLRVSEKEIEEPVPLLPSDWSNATTFYDAIQSIVRSQHHINTENL